jgi:hypothetical protein
MLHIILAKNYISFQRMSHWPPVTQNVTQRTGGNQGRYDICIHGGWEAIRCKYSHLSKQQLISYAAQATPDLKPPIAFNVSHDHALVAMAFGPGDHEPPAFQVGVDIMKVELPKREPFPQFVNIFSEQVSNNGSRVDTSHSLFNSSQPLKLAHCFQYLKMKASVGFSGYGR